jgi:CHAT domain-containing protein/tetratricopeptide (TPR) repeat protein
MPETISAQTEILPSRGTRQLLLPSLFFAALISLLVWGIRHLEQDRLQIYRRLGARLTSNEVFSRPRAEAAAAIAVADRRDLGAQRTRGGLLLTSGEVELAVRNLDEASSLAPKDARLLNDLAAAHLVQARERNDPFDLILALSTIDRALRLSPALLEARFNHALILERLYLRDAARHAWETYLDLDAKSEWAHEARNRHAALAEPSLSEKWEEQREKLERAAISEQDIERIVAQFPLQVRQYTEETILGSWAEAVEAGRSEEAVRLLQLAHRIGVAQISLKNDWMVADSVAAISSSKGVPKRQAALVEGHMKYREARRLHDAMRASEARPLFEQSRRDFALGESPIESLADLYLAVGQYNHLNYQPALRTLRRIVGDKKNPKYPGLLTKAYWTLGLVLLVEGQPAEAIDAYTKALAAATKAGATEDVAGVHAILAESFRYLGRPKETWKHLYKALALSPNIKTPRRLTAVLFEAAEACVAAGEPAAERYFRDESLKAARKAGEPTSLSNALLHRAWTLYRLRDSQGAENGLEEARWIAEQVRDEPQRFRLQAYLLIVESEIHGGQEPAEAIRALTWALDFFNERDNHYFRSRLYLARARAELMLGRDADAEDDLRSGIDEFEIQRRSLRDEPLKIAFFDQADGLFDEMIRLQSQRRGGAEQAFYYAERERARSLLDRLRPLSAQKRAPIVAGVFNPLAAREVQRAIPKDVALVEYSMLEDGLFTWVLDTDVIGLKKVEVTRRELDGLVTRLRRSFSRNQTTQIDSSAATLYDLLIRPVLPWIKAKDRIIFVPDGSLSSLPFTALLDRMSNRLFVQDYIVAVAPSATFYIHALERGQAFKSQEGQTALLVVNPSLNHRSSPSFPDLPSAEREADEVAALFPGSEVLQRSRATKRALLATAGYHDILHIGVHAAINREFPLLSNFLLAPYDGESSGLLYAHELYSVHTRKTRLAVLAGCNTAEGPVLGEGSLSLARAFLAMGIPEVVGSLWQVDDQESYRLLKIFYKRLQQGDDAASALGYAQRTLISDADSEGTWAAFEVIGGFSRN